MTIQKGDVKQIETGFLRFRSFLTYWHHHAGSQGRSRHYCLGGIRLKCTFINFALTWWMWLCLRQARFQIQRWSGNFRRRSLNIVSNMQRLVSQFTGHVPTTLNDSNLNTW